MDYNVKYTHEVGFTTSLIMNYIEGTGTNYVYRETKTITLNNNFNFIATEFAEIANKIYAFTYITLVILDHGILVVEGLTSDGDISGLFKYNITYYGSDTSKFEEPWKIIKKYDASSHRRIDWYYATSNGMRSEEISIHLTGKIHEEYYPNIPGGAFKFMEDFKNSDSNILILNGYQGTGKSSIISDFIIRNKFSTMTTYDETVMKNDQFFVTFITNDYDLLVLEDADTFLMSREDSRNSSLSKLLNVSDGLIKNNKKKIIITANLENKRVIDPAIIRPGRCFALIDFRKLIGEEIDNACAKIGVPRPGQGDEYSLAECFNASSINYRHKIGFGTE